MINLVLEGGMKMTGHPFLPPLAQSAHGQLATDELALTNGGCRR
jgi:hypothetical protein